MPSSKEYQRAWKKVNPDKVRGYNQRQHAKRKDEPKYKADASKRARKHKLGLLSKSPVTLLLYAAKHRAEKKGVPFNIVETDVAIPLVCPLLGVWMARKGPYAPSIDRIEPTKGYVPGNVWVISSKANLMKNDASASQLLTFARNVLRLLASETPPAT